MAHIGGSLLSLVVGLGVVYIGFKYWQWQWILRKLRLARTQLPDGAGFSSGEALDADHSGCGGGRGFPPRHRGSGQIWQRWCLGQSRMKMSEELKAQIEITKGGS